MGTLSEVYGRARNGVPVMLPQFYREYMEEIGRLRDESRTARRSNGTERPSSRVRDSVNHRCLKTKDAARYLGMSAWALREQVNKGQLAVVSSGEHTSSWKFDVRDLDAWIDRHKLKF